MTDYELYHFGIKGMKWGVRRYQNKDGSLTPAGKKRYSVDDVRSAKETYKKAKRAYSESYDRASEISSYSISPIKKHRDEYKSRWDDVDAKTASMNKARLEYKKVKSTFDYENSKAAQRAPENKSKHRLKLEESYRKLGMTELEAAAMADKRIRTEKILAASAALTVGACVAVAANRRLRRRIDGVIKAGEQMQRIEMKDTNGKLHDMFYVAKGKHDSKRYEGLLGMTRQKQTGEAWMMKLEATKDVKVASQDKAAKLFGDLYKNDDAFRSNVKDLVGAHFNGQNSVKDISDLSDKNIKKMYENFNCNIMFARDNSARPDNVFYNKLKTAGYGAIQDINDMKYSGYRAKNPLIVFDNSNSNIMVKSVEKIVEDKTASGMLELGKATCGQMLENMGPKAAVALTGATAYMYVSDPYTKEVNNIEPN